MWVANFPDPHVFQHKFGIAIAVREGTSCVTSFKLCGMRPLEFCPSTDLYTNEGKNQRRIKYVPLGTTREHKPTSRCRHSAGRFWDVVINSHLKDFFCPESCFEQTWWNDRTDTLYFKKGYMRFPRSLSRSVCVCEGLEVKYYMSWFCNFPPAHDHQSSPRLFGCRSCTVVQEETEEGLFSSTSTETFTSSFFLFLLGKWVRVSEKPTGDDPTQTWVQESPAWAFVILHSFLQQSCAYGSFLWFQAAVSYCF